MPYSQALPNGHETLSRARAQDIASFQRLTDRFMAWVGRCAPARWHAETGQRLIKGIACHAPLHAVEPSVLRDAFRLAVMRGVTSTASISLAGNRYSVDETLIGRRVDELRFAPQDMTAWSCIGQTGPAGRPLRCGSGG